MPQTVRDVGTRAFRKLGVLRAGGTMSSEDAAEALASLVSLYGEWITGGTFGRVVSFPLSQAGSFTATPNTHINVTVDDAVTVDLPATVPACWWDTWRPCRDYGWGLNVPYGSDPNVAMPRDKSVVRVTDQFGEGRATYVYDGTVQRWMRVDDSLGLTDEAPLSARNADGLAAVLATRLADQYGPELLSPGTVQAANRYRMALVTNYGNAEACGVYC